MVYWFLVGCGVATAIKPTEAKPNQQRRSVFQRAGPYKNVGDAKAQSWFGGACLLKSTFLLFIEKENEMTRNEKIVLSMLFATAEVGLCGVVWCYNTLWLGLAVAALVSPIVLLMVMVFFGLVKTGMDL